MYSIIRSRFRISGSVLNSKENVALLKMILSNGKSQEENIDEEGKAIQERQNCFSVGYEEQVSQCHRLVEQALLLCNVQEIPDEQD